MVENDHEETGKPKGSSDEGGPMAMGIAMAKKMMAPDGQGGSPMEMMQKMTAQMSGDGKPPMEKMMGMCSEMLNGSARPMPSPSSRRRSFSTPSPTG